MQNPEQFQLLEIASYAITTASLQTAQKIQPMSHDINQQ